MRIVVTGAGSGIGAAVTEVATARGWTPIAFDLTGQQPVDVGDERAVEQALERAWKDGLVDAVVCAAGILRDGRVEETEMEDWERVFRTNVFGVVHVLRGLGRRWTATGTHGRAVVLSSMAGERGMAASVAYCSTKAALNGLVRAVAIDWAPHGHRINAVLPGSVDTPMLRRYVEANGGAAAQARLDAMQPLGRVAAPREVAELCCYLASDQASYVTGATVAVDGALTLGYG
jgi:NAD(P)-dependent dehydrogenase (short-subunit alcohol dehydrogenase family)